MRQAESKMVTKNQVGVEVVSALYFRCWISRVFLCEGCPIRSGEGFLEEKNQFAKNVYI